MVHPSISKEHTVIEVTENGTAILKDLNSLNGTYLNGTKVQKGGQTALDHGDQVQFGKDPNQYTFYFSSELQRTKKPIKSPSQATSQAKREQPQSPKLTHKIESDAVVSLIGNPSPVKETPKNTITFANQEEPQHRTQMSVNVPHSPGHISDSNTSNLEKRLQSPHQQGGGFRNTADQFKGGPTTDVPRSPQQQPSNVHQMDAQNQILEKADRLNYQNEILELNEKVLERDEILIKREGELKLYKNEVESLRDDNERMKSKLKALELYASELQRKNDLLNRDLGDKGSQLQDMENTDWTKKAQISANESKTLRQLLISKDDEIANLKKQIQAILTNQAEGTVNSNHYQSFLEKQAQELSNAKKQLSEYESRNEECKRKWNQLIKENINKEEKVKGLTFQLNRHIETYQNLYSETDNKIASLHARISQLVNLENESKEREAAEFLVYQMRQIQEEREKMAVENESLHLQTQELISEVKRLNEEIQEYQKVFDKSDGGILDGRPVPNVGKMKSRIEELEDILYENKQKEGARRIVELTEVVGDLEKRLDKAGKHVDELKQKIIEQNRCFDREYSSGSANQDQNAIDFFSKLLEDKDQKLTYLQRQNEMLVSKEKQLQVENQKLRENLQNIGQQFETYKARQSKLDDIASIRLNSGQISDARKGLDLGAQPSPLAGLRYGNDALMDMGTNYGGGGSVGGFEERLKNDGSATDTYLK